MQLYFPKKAKVEIDASGDGMGTENSEGCLPAQSAIIQA
jgi:hypothetical protein